jgi:hypothetical protein
MIVHRVTGERLAAPTPPRVGDFAIATDADGQVAETTPLVRIR